MIRIEGLSKRFGTSVAVDDLWLEIAPGELFGFLGPNGAGKTTTIRMLTGLIGPTSGQAWVAGLQLGQDDTELRRQVGILTEAPGLYDTLSAERNLAFFAELYGVVDIAGQVERYLRLLGLWNQRREPTATFSRGMRQKLAIARALLHEPRVLFLDEPTTGLDPEAAHLVRDFIEGLKGEGRTIFICTHNLDEADRLCDRIGVFNTRLLALDAPGALRRQIFGRTVVFHLAQLKPEFQKILTAFPFVKAVETVDSKLVVTLADPESENPALITALVEAGAQLQFVGELRRSLEDVYLHLLNQSNPGKSRPEEATS
ncbi:MAG: ABC transporter ATP-binding protein [Anaerolineales bacterium]